MKATKPNQHQIKSTLMPTSLALQHNDNEYASPTLYTICINNTSSQGCTQLLCTGWAMMRIFFQAASHTRKMPILDDTRKNPSNRDPIWKVWS